VVTAVVDVVLEVLEEEVEVEVDVLVLVDVEVLPVLRGPINVNEGKAEIRTNVHLAKRLRPLKKNVTLKLKTAIRSRNLDSGRHRARHINNKNIIKKKPP